MTHVARTTSRSPSTAIDAPRVRYVYLVGAPYCGSTLLTFLLNTHPQCVSVGESFGLMRDAVVNKYACSCGMLLLECPFWSKLVERMQTAGQPMDLCGQPWKTRFVVSRNRWINGIGTRSLGGKLRDEIRDAVLSLIPGVQSRFDEAGATNAALARAALAITGASVFLDGSKVAHRVKQLARVRALDLRVIHLIRDPRGGTASILKNARVASAAKAARYWMRRNLEADRARRFVAPDRWLALRYSELCDNAQAVTDRISDFLNIPRSTLPNDFRSVEHHLLGNQMRLRSGAEIREDLSWQQFLTQDQLDTVARVAGAASRRFGYDWP